MKLSDGVNVVDTKTHSGTLEVHDVPSGTVFLAESKDGGAVVSFNSSKETDYEGVKKSYTDRGFTVKDLPTVVAVIFADVNRKN